MIAFRMNPLSKFWLVFISFALFGCTTSPTHVGIVWDRSTGNVSSSDARKAQKLVEEFHSYLVQEHWEAVYGDLDRRLQDSVGKRELENAFRAIKKSYGNEMSFGLVKAAPTEFLHRLTKLGYDDPKHSKGFEYYDALVAEYMSART